MSILQAPVPAGPALRALAASVFLASITVSSGPAAAQVASQSVNMVSGIQWPGGDPFLQRQNEPSVAMSSRNPRHLLAGANDYRTVDIPFATPNAPETGDAWLGVFKSFDGGVTWRSTLLPGYPQQPGGPTGPLAGYTTAADPVVRAGTNGLFYYSGIAFNRDTKGGVVFVARFMDLNNKENGDPANESDAIRYIDTKVIDSAATNAPFIDKPWIAVDKPRLLDGVCNLSVPQPLPGKPNAAVSQTVPAGAVYAAWTEVSGTGSALTTNVFFSSSSDCGGTWNRPVKLNDTNKVNQGASIAIDPATGVVYVVWRRLASGSQTDAIMMTRSFRGRLFSTPSVVVSLPAYSNKNPTAPSFFDQGTTGDSFRTTAYPVIGIDRRPDAGSEDDDEPDTPAFRGKVFVAWSQRGIGPAGDARVVLTVSTDGGSTWSTPKAVDNSDLTDDTGHVFSRGHQFMPQMTVTADKITIIYYDARFDHTFGLFSPWNGWYNSFLPDPVTGKFYLETRALRGELLDPGGSTKVFTPFFVETGMTEWRHTLDLRFAQADSAVSPVFSSSRLSQYSFGTRGDEVGAITALQQLQIDPPNLRLFQQGSVPFIGDYIDVAGPTFQPPVAPGRRWRFNSLPGTSPVFLASWTSNQDVRPPFDGDWTHYTPAGSTTTGAQSVFNTGFQRPPCVIGQEGMRNQNIYAARISQGFAVTSAQNAKPLSSTLQRDLALSVENLTPLERTFRLTIAGQPTGGRASFVPAPNPPPSPLPVATTTLDVVIPANSAVARSVYALSTDAHARIEVDVAEVNGAPGSALKTNGLTGFVIFNTDSSAPTLIDPDNNSAGSVTTVEIYNPNVSNPNVSNPNVSNPNVSNPNVSNPNVSNPNVSNPNVSNPNVSNPDLANPNVSNPNVSNPNVSNPNVSNPNVSNPNVSNPNVSNAPVSDATYTVTNTGNTASTYRIQLVGTAPSGTPLQLIITKPYANPASLNCVLFEQQHNIPVANVINPEVIGPGSPPGSGITDPSDGNATFVLGPGESILVTIRAPVDIPTLTNIIQNLAPVVVAHAPNTNDTTNQPATSPPVITTSALPDGVAGQAYSAPITALGGRPPYTWTATGLPANLSISGTTTGQISGTPSATGTFSVGVSAKDSASKTGSRTYTLRIAGPLGITTASLPNGTVGVGYSQPLAASGGLGTYTWSLAGGSPPPGVLLSPAGVLAGTPTTSGTYPFTVKVTDSAAPAQTATQALTVTVVSIAGPAVLTFTVQPTNSTGGQPMASVKVQALDGTASPVSGASITIAPGTIPCLAAILTGPTTAMTDATGVATFTGLSIDRGGWGYTLAASVTGNPSINVTSNTFNVEGFCTTGNLTPSRYDITLTKLADGRVLLTGGIQPGSTNIFNTATVYDASTGQFTPAAGTMTTTRAGHRAVLLPSGKVLLAGGFSGPLPPGPPLSTAELFDPLSQTFALTAGLPGASRSSFRAIWVPGVSKVLILGGSNGVDLASAELYDPATDTFSATTPMTTPRSSHTADLLPDGRILVVGGFSGSATLATAEIWDPTTGTFTPTGPLHSPRSSHASATLPDGRVLVAGGVPTRGGSALATAEIYDPVTATFTPAAAMTAARSEPLLSVLPSGKVLVASGWDAANATLTSAELFDPVSGVFTSTGSSWAAHTEGEGVLLSTGNVLVAGGWTGFGTADLFFPLPPTVFLVTNTADAGAGSLRQAILDANAHPGLDAIHFAIPGSGVQTISPASALPVITDPVLLDATTQPGYAGTPLIHLDGAGISFDANGIEVHASNSVVKGFIVTRFSNTGILLTGASATQVASNFVGTDGATAFANLAGGIFVNLGAGNVITGNLVSGNGSSGILLFFGATNTTVSGNQIGTNAAGTAALGNTYAGIYLHDTTTTLNTVSRNLCSGNGNYGITISTGANHNTITGNLIGSDVSGLLAVPNGLAGIVIQDAAHDNMIGGTTTAEKNLLSGNTGSGIMLSGSSSNTVRGNWIGTNATGNAALPNGNGGVVAYATFNETIGGTVSGAGNVISGNTLTGLVLGTTVTNALVAGNLIGTDPTGSAPVPNTVGGISVFGADTSVNTIRGNLVSGNTSFGVSIASGAAQITLLGNRIGTNMTGLSAIPNIGDGVELGTGAHNNVVGGTAPGEGNVIGFNTQAGVLVRNVAANQIVGNQIAGNGVNGITVDYTTTGTIISTNRIGTNADGTAALGNAGDGVGIYNGAASNTVSDNIIAASTNSGLRVDGSLSNTIRHNWIGTNAALSSGLGNLQGGISVWTSTGTIIGGSGPTDANVIAYNGQTGINIYGSNGAQIIGNLVSGNNGNGIVAYGGSQNATIAGNRIGVNSAGTAAWGNTNSGIIVDGVTTTGILIGGAGPGAGNVISGNSGTGIQLSGGVSGTSVVRNLIGTNAAGTAAIPNSWGVYLMGADTSLNTITQNVVSGNAANGLDLRDGAHDNVMRGNLIGSDLTGTVRIPNGGDGILITDGAHTNTIGGTGAGVGNVIVGNNAGIVLGNTQDNLIQGNWIGTNPALASGLGGTYGVYLNTSNSLIGGMASGAANVIAYNVVGVEVYSGSGNAILSNSVFGNQLSGISLSSGTNGGVTSPLIASAVDDGSRTLTSGTVTLPTPIPGVTLYLQFFANPTCEHPPFGEGRTLLGTYTVVTDGAGVSTFSVSLPTGLLGGVVTATTSTVAGAGGNTSGFSACRTVAGP